MNKIILATTIANKVKNIVNKTVLAGDNLLVFVFDFSIIFLLCFFIILYYLNYFVNRKTKNLHINVEK